MSIQAASVDHLTVWAVVFPSGRTCALFASQELADEWIARNPQTCAGAVSEEWAVHTLPLAPE